MKEITLFITFCLALFFSSCERYDTPGPYPSCLEAIIKETAERSCEGTASIKEYLFQGKLVYYIDPGNCSSDQGYQVLDTDCAVIGILGTIAGITDINGEDFRNATFTRTIWERD